MERYVNGEWENRKVKCEIYVNIMERKNEGIVKKQKNSPDTAG